MRRTIITILVLAVLTSFLLPEKDHLKYFRMDKIVSVTGKILRIRMEDRYRKNRFIVLELKEKKTEKVFDVEVSPLWFYQVDVVEGSIVSVKGSLNHLDKKDVILAQSLTFSGEIFSFRDKFGFPLWRGGKHGMGKNKWKGEMRQKGKK